MPLATPPSAVQGQIISHDELCCFQSIFHSFSPALNEPRMGKSLRSQLHHPLRLGFADALSREVLNWARLSVLTSADPCWLLNPLP